MLSSTRNTVLLSGMATYRIFVRLFDRQLGRASAATVLTLLAGIAFRTEYTPSGLLYAQGWTGEAALANVLLPVLLLIALFCYDGGSALRSFLLLLVAGAAALSLTPVSLMVYPVAAAAFVIPAAIAGKHPRHLLSLCLSLALPAAAVLVRMYYPGIPV